MEGHKPERNSGRRLCGPAPHNARGAAAYGPEHIAGHSQHGQHSGMSRRLSSPWLAVPLAGAPLVVQATQYLSVEQAQRVLFPTATAWAPQPLEVSDDQARAIEQASGVEVVNRRPTVWRALAGDTPLGTLFVDQVYGKHEFITYALAVTADGQVAGVEILDYRETHGDEVRQPRWRAQFVGKKASDAVKLGRDIQNISGATLSCRHLTDGVRRLLATQRLLLAATP
jgi:hypothetical protein